MLIDGRITWVVRCHSMGWGFLDFVCLHLPYGLSLRDRLPSAMVGYLLCLQYLTYLSPLLFRLTYPFCNLGKPSLLFVKLFRKLFPQLS